MPRLFSFNVASHRLYSRYSAAGTGWPWSSFSQGYAYSCIYLWELLLASTVLLVLRKNFPEDWPQGWPKKGNLSSPLHIAAFGCRAPWLLKDCVLTLAPPASTHCLYTDTGVPCPGGADASTCLKLRRDIGGAKGVLLPELLSLSLSLALSTYTH